MIDLTRPLKPFPRGTWANYPAGVIAGFPANMLISRAELAKRRKKLERQGFPYPASQTPWQEIQRAMVDQLADGMVLKPAVKYQRIAQKSIPRDNH